MPDWNELLPHVGNGYVQAAVIFVAALVGGWIADVVITRGVARLTRKTETDLDDQLIDALHRPIRVSIVVAGLVLVTQRLDPSRLLEGGTLNLTGLTLNLLATVVILVWLTAGLRVSRILLESASSGATPRLEAQAVPLLRNVANIAIVAAAAYFALVTWGINPTAWLASAGIVGIAVGFAAKDTLSNFFAGFFILTDAPYKVGDWVNLASGDRGQVTHVGIRSTRLLTRDDIEITIPNSIIANAKIANESSGRWVRHRLRVPVGVAYGSDVDHVRRVLEEVGRADPDTCAEPDPRVRFRAFGESSLDFELLAWIDDPVDRGRVLDSLHTAVYKAFQREGIRIPFPQRDLWVRQIPSRDAEPAED